MTTKTWDQLDNLQRSTSLERAKTLLVNLIIEGVINLQMPDKSTQQAFDTILSQSRREENPNMGMMNMFANKKINAELDKISIAAAQGSRYDENGLSLTNQQ